MAKMFTLTIECGNDLFANSEQDCDFEVARILRGCAADLEQGAPYTITLRDGNGNPVGKCGYNAA